MHDYFNGCIQYLTEFHTHSEKKKFSKLEIEEYFLYLLRTCTKYNYLILDLKEKTEHVSS